MRIAIDAGHGPNTPGKRCPDDSMREFQFNRVVARYVREELERMDGVATLFTHADDGSRDIPVNERYKKANDWPADVFVSIHANASGNGGWDNANGVETLLHVTKDTVSVKLAQAVQRNLVKATGLRDRGLVYCDTEVGVLKYAKMPRILVECGFMTNRSEVEQLKSDEYRRKCAAAIADGIAEVFTLRLKDGLSMEKDTELQTKVAALQKRVEALETIACPDWAKPHVDAAVKAGLVTEATGTNDFFRLITVMHKAGLFK